MSVERNPAHRESPIRGQGIKSDAAEDVAHTTDQKTAGRDPSHEIARQNDSRVSHSTSRDHKSISWLPGLSTQLDACEQMHSACDAWNERLLSGSRTDGGSVIDTGRWGREMTDPQHANLGLGETIVECPFEDCEGQFDAVEASFVGTGAACPACGASWKQCCAAVEPVPDPDEIEHRTNHDGSTAIVEAGGDVDA